MRFEILGPVRVVAGGGELRITAGRERTVLATLLLQVNEPVSIPQLIEGLWDGEPPDNARNQVQGCISRLRRQLADAGAPRDIIVTNPAGYRLRVAPSQLDLSEFRRLRDEARAAAADRRGMEASQRYRAALGVWRGVPLAGVDSELVRRASAALAEERIQLLEECVHVELGVGRGGELAAELTELARAHPYREGLHGALMLALYQAGRQADALAVYRRLHQVLHDDLGCEPDDHLQQLHLAVLNRDPELAAGRVLPPQIATAPPASAPRELPAQVTGFTGRHETLKVLDNLLPAGDPDAPEPVVISVITGTAGVGKTALAVQWAHRIANRFPDGQLYLNLRGYAAGAPLRPIEALTALLRSLGTSADEIPTDEAQAAARYRSQLAGRRVLVVLDNAASSEQVRPLLPGTAGCLALATSRNRLAGLTARDGARPLTLDVLPPEEAQALLAHLLGPERVAAEPGASAALATACGFLPLALRIAAATLAERPYRAIDSYVAELATGDRLAVLAVDDDPDSAVRGALDLSYRAIPDEAQRLFRRIGLVPGPDVTSAAAAALIDASVADTARLLRRLTNVHLVDEYAHGRFTFHELLRLYAARLAEAEDGDADRAATAERLFTYYLYTADAAATVLHPQMLRLPLPPSRTATPVQIGRPTDALDWFDAERPNLVAAVTHAAGPWRLSASWLLADRLRGYFWHGRHTADWLVAATAALGSAEQAGDPEAQAAAHFSLAHLHQCLARHPEAIAHYTAAVDHAELAGWAHCQAAAQSNLGMVCQDLGQLERSAAHYTRSLTINKARGDLGGQAVNLVNLGMVDRELGRLRRAADHLSQARTMNRDLGYRHGEAVAAYGLAQAQVDLGALAEARGQLTHALTVFRETGDRPGAAASLRELAAVDHGYGRHSEAAELARQAATLAAEIGDRRVEADALNLLGQVRRQLGGPSLEHHQQARELARQARVRLQETEALLGLAAAHHQLGDQPAAADLTQQALGHAREAGYRVLEGRGLALLADIQHATGDAQAAQTWQAASELFAQTAYASGHTQAWTQRQPSRRWW